MSISQRNHPFHRKITVVTPFIIAITTSAAVIATVNCVVETASDSTLLPDGAALSAYQYFENVRNSLVALEEMGLPTFEASDLEQGGTSARVVNSVLALKSYHEWKQTGGTGAWKFGGNAKPIVTIKQFVRKNSEPFTTSLSRNSSMTVKSLNVPNSESLSTLINALQSDINPEEVPQLVESVLSKVVEEFEHCIDTSNDLGNQPRQAMTKGVTASQGKKAFVKVAADISKVEDRTFTLAKKQESLCDDPVNDEQWKNQVLDRQMTFHRQGRDAQEPNAYFDQQKLGCSSCKLNSKWSSKVLITMDHQRLTADKFQ